MKKLHTKCPLYIGKENTTEITAWQNKLSNVQTKITMHWSTGCIDDARCLQEYIDTTIVCALLHVKCCNLNAYALTRYGGNQSQTLKKRGGVNEQVLS